MFSPSILEKDLSCWSLHSQPIESVILDDSIPLNRRLLCKLCENISQPKMPIVEYHLLKQIFDEYQMEKIKKYELIITPHINIIKQLKETIASLRTRLIQLLDYLLWLSDDWIKAMIESITSYSFFEQLNNVLSLKETFIDSNQLINKTRKMHQDWKIKINFKLEEFKHFSEFKQFSGLINDLEQLTNNQEDELKSQSIIKLQENQFIKIIKQQIRTQPQEVLIFEDFIYKKIHGYEVCNRLKKQFSIKKTEKHIIYTSSEGEVIRSDQVNQQQELLKKWEQILHLQWNGQCGQDGKKIGNWIATWKGDIIQGVGGQYIDGNKQGQWVDIIPNYQSYARAFEIGQYNASNRIGNWRYKYEELEFGGGSYDQEGNQKKIGKWGELFEGFQYYAQVTYNGEYNMNNMKVGRWDICWVVGNEIGGGSYDSEGNQKKIGKWVELFEGFQYFAQVTCNGEYNMNNMKIGRWDIMYCKEDEEEYKQIGGGSYDQEGNQKKIGKWVELDKRFWAQKQVTYNGEYNMNNMKIGRWDIMYCKEDEEEYKQIIFKSTIIYSGGGSYDQEGNQKKIGKWVELFEGFWHYAQVTYNGEYNMNNMKVGRWDIIYDRDGDGIYKKMIFEFTIIYIVVVEHMIKKEIRKRLESGQNWMKSLVIIIKSLIMENIIKKVKKQVFGQK